MTPAPACQIPYFKVTFGLFSEMYFQKCKHFSKMNSCRFFTRGKKATIQYFSKHWCHWFERGQWIKKVVFYLKVTHCERLIFISVTLSPSRSRVLRLDKTVRYCVCLAAANCCEFRRKSIKLTTPPLTFLDYDNNLTSSAVVSLQSLALFGN